MDQAWETLSTASNLSTGSTTQVSSPASSPSSDEGSLLGFLSLQNSILAKELEKLPTNFMLNVLEEMSHQPELVHLQLEVLSNPINVSKILHLEPCGREKILKFFLILEKSSGGFVWNLTEQYSAVMALLPNLPDSHLLGFTNNLELGSFLVETGWYAEASVILSIARRQAGTRPLELLKTHRVALIAESLSSRYEEASQTIADIATLIKHAKDVPMGLTAGLHQSLAVCFFEECDFEGSYQHGVMALQLLDDSSNNCPNETIVGTFRQLARTCIAMKRPSQAKLLITQAVSWARHHFGAGSVLYAEALEDFAFYLLTVNAYRDCLKIESEVKDVYFNLFGHLALQPELAQGNLAFRLYLESYGYKNIGSIDQYLDYVLDLDRGRGSRNGTDDRQMLAIKRIPAMMAVTNMAHEENLSSSEFEEVMESIRAPPLVLDDVRKLFFTN